MNLELIKVVLSEIESLKQDAERATWLEQNLQENFIQFVADGNYGELTLMAKEILKSYDIRFDRF